MSPAIHNPQTRGHEPSNLNTGKGGLERALAAHLAEHDLRKPQTFRMRVRLPKKGRGSALLAATDRMWVNLKTYAEGGENTLHAHTNEDHTFIVLQGRATFYGLEGEAVTFSRNEGILLPRGCRYYFHAEPGEALVLLRVGCVVDAEASPWTRTGSDGEPLPGSSKENKSVTTEFSDEYFQ
ncbi:cupin domain-containing protein [Marinobacter algicola]|uniref:Cupin 2, conserved barrel n=1 Tax=Marinobacter algicola DG893 TaxID=443152 RepID=A6F053_9GAMM|nr:cupin domain-containing protein [Marinobacter algicola]EDM47966.1 Cupin 2, conserved barrel [Marinobacter algicola DG893]